MNVSRFYGSMLAVTMLAMFSGAAFAAPKEPASLAELALYKGADRQQILEEGAKKEGKLTFYTSGILTGWVNALNSRFEKKYPYIKVETWRASAGEVLARVKEEYKAGKYAVGAKNFAHSTTIVGIEAGILQPFYSPSLAGMKEDAVIWAPGGGAYAAVHYEVGYALAYNTKLMNKKDVPTSYRDLLDPKWKGKMPIPGTTAGVDWMGNLLVAYGEDFVRQLAKQEFAIHMISGFPLLQMIAGGEYPFSPALADTHVQQYKEKGASVEWVALDPVQISAGFIGLPKYSPQPHAALLFNDFILSREAAEAIFKPNGYWSARKDMDDPRTYRKFYGAKSSQEYQEWTRLFNNLFLKLR